MQIDCNTGDEKVADIAKEDLHPNTSRAPKAGPSDDIGKDTSDALKDGKGESDDQQPDRNTIDMVLEVPVEAKAAVKEDTNQGKEDREPCARDSHVIGDEEQHAILATGVAA